jgi:hypothetical protein
VISWLLTSWPGQLALVILAGWFLNGLRKALFKPRIKIVRLAASRAGTFVDVERQQLLPPWMTFKETWVRDSSGQEMDFIRQSDGVRLSSDRFGPVYLNRLLANQLAVWEAKQKADAEALATLDRLIAERDRLSDLIDKSESKRTN